MTSNENPLPHWSDTELRPLHVCRRTRLKAREFPTPQAAWNAWDNPNEMLWLLRKRKYDSIRLLACALGLVGPVMSIMHEYYPKTRLFFEAEAAVRRWRGVPSEENKELVASFLPRMKGALEGKRIPWHAANSIRKLAQCVFDRGAFTEIAMEVAFALHFAAKHRPANLRRLLPGIPNDELSLDRIAEYQCDIVRLHFRNEPSV